MRRRINCNTYLLSYLPAILSGLGITSITYCNETIPEIIVSREIIVLFIETEIYYLLI